MSGWHSQTLPRRLVPTDAPNTQLFKSREGSLKPAASLFTARAGALEFALCDIGFIFCPPSARTTHRSVNVSYAYSRTCVLNYGIAQNKKLGSGARHVTRPPHGQKTSTCLQVKTTRHGGNRNPFVRKAAFPGQSRIDTPVIQVTRVRNLLA